MKDLDNNRTEKWVCQTFGESLRSRPDIGYVKPSVKVREVGQNEGMSKPSVKAREVDRILSHMISAIWGRIGISLGVSFEIIGVLHFEKSGKILEMIELLLFWEKPRNFGNDWIIAFLRKNRILKK